MKKTIAILVIILLCSSAFGCSKSSKKNGKGEQKTIKVATFYSSKEQGAALKEIAKEFEKQNKDVKVEIITDYSDEEKVKESVSTTGDIDIIGIKRNQLIEFGKSGYLADLTEFVDSKELDKSLYKISLAYGKYNDKIYGIGNMPMTLEWFYNKDLFEKNGIKEPKDLNELISICTKLKSKKITPMEIGGMDNWTLSLLFGAITAQTTGSMELTAGYDSDEKALEKVKGIDDAFNYFSKLTKGCISKDSLDINYKQSMEDFISGKTAIVPSGSWSVKLIDQTKNATFNYGVFKTPIKFTENPMNLVSATSGEILVVPEKSKNKKDAEKFLEFLFSGEGQRIFTSKGYTSSLKTANAANGELESNILTHIDMADDNSIMLVDNIEPKLSENLGYVLTDVFEGRVSPKEAWKRLLKMTYKK